MIITEVDYKDLLIAALLKENQELRNECTTDVLTGIGNRRKFQACYDNLFALALRYSQDIAIAVFDIDNFKAINTLLGHVEADIVLQKVALHASATIRRSDLCCRHGGEEFVILMPNTNLPGAMAVAEKVRMVIDEIVGCTVSVGISSIKVQSDSDQLALLKLAYDNMMVAKKLGKNRVYSSQVAILTH